MVVVAMPALAVTPGTPAASTDIHGTYNSPTSLSLANALPSNTIGTGSLTGAIHCSTEGTTIHWLNESEHQGDITIPVGQSYIVGDRTLKMAGNFIVDGGKLIVRNATLTRQFPSAPTWILERGGCMEFTDARDLIGDDLWIGGRGSFGVDNSTLIVNRSTVQISALVTGSNEVVKIDDSIWAGFLYLLNSPLGSTSVAISNTIIAALGFSFTGGQGGNISGLRPGHLANWDLHKNETVFNIPYDLRLNNVTVIPNTLGQSPGGGHLGWIIGLSVSSTLPCFWPNLTIRNSELSVLEFFVFGRCNFSEPFTLSDLGSNSPLNRTLFGTIRLVDSTVNGGVWAISGLSLKFVNVNGIASFPRSGTNITFINSTLVDFGPTNCICTFTFVNSSWGIPNPHRVEEIPYYRNLPLADELASATGWGSLYNDRIRMIGNLTFHLGDVPPWSNSTVTRFYPIIVTDARGQGLANAALALSTPDGREVQRRTTDRYGRSEITISFDDTNRTKSLVLTSSTNNFSGRTEVSFLTDTPIKLILAPPHAPPFSSTALPLIGLGIGAGIIVVMVAVVVARRRRKASPPKQGPKGHLTE